MDDQIPEDQFSNKCIVYVKVTEALKAQQAEFTNMVASIISKMRVNLTKPVPYLESVLQNYLKITLISMATKFVLIVVIRNL